VIDNAQTGGAAKRATRRMRAAGSVRRHARHVLLRAASRRKPSSGMRVLAYHLMPETSVFRAHVEAIRSAAEIIDESDFLAALEAPESASGRCKVLLTFDDGYRQQLTGHSLHIVKELELRPTVFVLAAAVDPTVGNARRIVRSQRHASRPLADEDELRTAVDAGWYVGSHTSTHWDCGSGSREDLRREIAESKVILERRLGLEVRTFAYPFGRQENVSTQAREELARSGYRAAFTAIRGSVAVERSSVYDLPRDVVEDWWGAREIRGCLAGALDRYGIRT
jgi:peptidoglycan/xylan/chitin deacetylase (PgdA/CDA1 family)